MDTCAKRGILSLVVGGDLRPGPSTRELFVGCKTEALFGDLLGCFSNSDLVVLNLECPLVGRATPIRKTGPCFAESGGCAETLRAAGVHAVNLANNHIMDQGWEGLDATMASCRRAGLGFFGAGEDLAAAGECLIREVDGHRVALLGMAEAEFSTSTKGNPGANPLDVIRYVRWRRRTRDEFDWLVVLLHGGVQHFPFPTPDLQKTCRFLVEEGATAVICQHSHCPGCYEIYQGKPIIYGQGNLIAESQCKHGISWHQGFLVLLSLRAGEEYPSLQLVPYLQSYDAPGARLMTAEEEALFREGLERRCLVVLSDEAVAEQWVEYCNQHRRSYISQLRGYGYFLRRLNQRSGFGERVISAGAARRMLNAVRCESHREALITVLERLQQANGSRWKV
ncbi:MAG: CapA family protein [Verrucomicrobiia bacterium]